MNEQPRTAIRVRPADLNQPEDNRHVIELLDMYSREPLGQAAPLAETVRERLLPGLREHPTTLILLAFVESSAVGIAVCFVGFSTFAARPLLNIHDLAVRPEWRGRGAGRALLHAAQQQAVQLGCCKMTLEVRNDNHIARQLYRDFGFASGSDDSSAYAFWTKYLTTDAAAPAP